MRVGIPLLGQRVAPRCTIADSVLLVTLRRRRVVQEAVLPFEGSTWMDLARILADEDVDTLVCGGISRSTRESVQSQAVEVIDNVAGTAQDVVDALRRGGLRSGFGLATQEIWPEPERDSTGAGTEARPPEPSLPAVEGEAPERSRIDCLACADRACLLAEPCPYVSVPAPAASPAVEPALEAAWDVACEHERRLCRLAELVYFALEMGYTRLGVAFCTDLREPTSILTEVLRRFFDVVPVCCKVPRPRGPAVLVARGRQGGTPAVHDTPACDPAFQAAVLNEARTDLNVLVGLCVGADGIFARESRAPVTTIFVKDKSLANNPIGAVYSHYHLKEI
jgi:uncharacterized metal-binding protein/predicted Fe-Mo cluster-binding NifX family protein